MQPDEGGAMGAHPIRPARFWYWVAGAAVVAAVLWLALSLFLGFRSLSRQVEGFQRVPIPGQAELSFAEPGGTPSTSRDWEPPTISCPFHGSASR